MVRILKKIKKNYDRNKMLKNVFKTNYKKNVLISYITTPFIIKKEYKAHTNSQECYILAKVFSENKYNVDMINYNYNGKEITLEKYNVLFGFGDVLEKSFFKNFLGKRIYYATGSHVFFQNMAELNRILELEKVKGILFKPRRLVEKNWNASTTLSDALIVLGNEKTINTYKKYYKNSNVYKLDVTAHNFFQEANLKRDCVKSRKSFVWMGSSGLILKGLDLCLEVFSELPTFDLHIFGPLEDDFYEYYKPHFELKNIHYHGFVDISSDEFKTVIENSMFNLYPSASEGQATSVITLMKTGLIPIISEETGITLDKSQGFYIEKLEKNYIKEKILEISRLETLKLTEMSRNVSKHSIKKYSLENFERNFTSIILKLLKSGRVKE